MVDSLTSTRQSSPTYHLKRPVKEISLNDLLAATANNLLGAVVTTLQAHSQRYTSHLDQQRLFLSSYFKAMAKSRTLTVSTKTVTKPCVKSGSCKQPATFQVHSTQLEINKSLDLEARNAHKQASEYFFTMVDSRVCTQTGVSLSRIKSVVSHLSHPVISNIQRSVLLDLAWSCLVFLWEQLKLIVNYPPVKSFLREASEILAPVISGNTATIDRLLTLFESDYSSIIFLYHVFQYNKQHHNTLIERYQRITLLTIAIQKAAFLEKDSSASSLSQSLSALEYLIASFDFDTWSNSDTAMDEAIRQSLYLAACDFIQQQDDLQQKYGDSNKDGMDRCKFQGNNLVFIVISHIMTVMITFIRKQQKSMQGEHLYVLHLLLDTLAATHNQYINSNTSGTGLTNALDRFMEVLSQQPTETMIVTQHQWKLQDRPEMRRKWTRLNDPAHTLDTILTMNTQVCTLTKTQHCPLQIYGLPGCMTLARLIFVLLMDPRIQWDFKLLVRCFEMFWNRSHDATDMSKNIQHEYQATIDATTDTRHYITQLFELSLELLLSDRKNDNNNTLQTALNDLHQYFRNSLLHQVDTCWLDLLLPIFSTLPWKYISPLPFDTMETMLTTCIRLRQDDRLKFIAYSSLVFSVLQQTIIGNHQQHMAPLDQCRRLKYVELSFLFLVTAEWIWPDEAVRLENLESLWGPIIGISGELNAEDMLMVLEVTHIHDPSNWRSSLEKHSGIAGNSGDQDCLAICIQWMRHLTIEVGDTGSMKLVSVFGHFILDHIKKMDNIGVQMDWLKVLLDQADGYMTKYDASSEFNDCVGWFRTLIGTLLDELQQRHHKTTAGIDTMMDTICEAIYTSEYSTTLVMFTACAPLKSSSTPTSMAPSTSTEPLTSINFRLRVMECCLEHCLQLRHGTDVWLRVGVLLQDTYTNNENGESTSKSMETLINEHIQHSMERSLFLVLNGYCHAKLQQSYSLMDGKSGTTNNNDHHVAEEIAAILSMSQMGDSSGVMDVQQAKKKMVLVRLFAHLLSKNKGEKSLDLWLASAVSLARSCAYWSTLAENQAPSQGQARKTGSANKHDNEWMTWKALVKSLECFLASRLAMVGIPPYAGMIPNDNPTTKLAPWLTILEQKKKKDVSHKNLFDFAVGVIGDLDRWTLWELDDFVLQLDGLSFEST